MDEDDSKLMFEPSNDLHHSSDALNTYSFFSKPSTSNEMLLQEKAEESEEPFFPSEAFPLHSAVKKNNIKFASSLLSAGADVKIKNYTGDTVLHLVEEKQSIELAVLLVEYDADVNSQNRNGDTPLHLAVRQNNYKLARLLLEHGALINLDNSNGDIVSHEVSDNVEMMALLVEYGVNLNHQNKSGETPLHVAALCGFSNNV